MTGTESNFCNVEVENIDVTKSLGLQLGGHRRAGREASVGGRGSPVFFFLLLAMLPLAGGTSRAKGGALGLAVNKMSGAPLKTEMESKLSSFLTWK